MRTPTPFFLALLLLAAASSRSQGAHGGASQPAMVSADSSGNPTESASAIPGGERDSLESTLRGHYMILDWSGGGREPARFSIHSSTGRPIATRRGKRSVQGWIASLRVAGWPRGLYRISAESGDRRATGSFLIR